MKATKITDWRGCYEGGWNGLVVPEAFQHPAKFSYALVTRIVEHGLSQGYWKPGDVIGDPFGGVALGSIACAYRGLNWIGVELEPRFVELGRKNIAMHLPKLARLHQTGVWGLLEGDSRQFAKLVGQVAGVVSSPPFVDQVPSHDNFVAPHDTNRRMATDRDTAYGSSSGQIGNLKAGDFDAIITSPPYADSGQGFGSDKNAERATGMKNAKAAESGNAFRGGYGETEGQIGSLKVGELDAVITSPPYADSVNSQQHGIDWDKAGPATGNRKRGEGSKHEETLRSQLAYGQTDGQIGALKSGDLDGVISSPPYAGAGEVLGNHNGIDYSKSKTGGRRRTEAREAAGLGYGESSGQIGAIPTGSLDGIVTSPPYAATRQDGGGIAKEGVGGFSSYSEGATDKWHTQRDPSNIGNLGDEKNVERETYWQAMHAVYSSMRDAIKPGGVAAIVVKDYVKNKQRVPLCDQTCTLLESLGFEVFERCRCWLVKETREPSLFGGEHVTTTERKSFFRRLAEKKGSPRIDWEETIWCRKNP